MSSAVFYHLQAISLKKFYLKNLTFTEMVYKFHGVAYVPEDKVIRIFEEQVVAIYQSLVDPTNGDPEWIRESEKLGLFMKYLEFWIGKRKWNPKIPTQSATRRKLWLHSQTL